MSRIPLIPLALLAPLVLVADDITFRRFPDADSVTVDEIEKVKYNPDGTYEQTDECWTKILTEKGRREESSLSLGYSKRYGEAGIAYVGAIAADGTEREIDVSATTKEQTDNSSMSANIYDPLDRVITCTIPGLKIGETLHVKTWRKTTKPRCQDKWSDIAVMEWTHPIVKSTYEVTAPASRPLRKIAIRHPLGNIITNVTKLADGSLVHTFTATNSAQAFAEPDMPPMYTQVQNIRVSTSESWPEISKWYWDLCAPHLAKTNAAMVAMVGKLAGEEGAGNREQVMRRIFKFVSQEVRYMGLTMEDTSPGYAPHDVDITFDNRYGVCRDKAGLLVAMLRLAGFKAFPVLIHVGAKLDPEVPQPFFNHAIVAVEAGSGGLEGLGGLECSSNLCQTAKRQTFRTSQTYVLMDPTNENTKDLFPSYLCNSSYLVCRPEGENLATSAVPPPEENALAIDSSAALSRDGSMFYETELRFGGINDTMYRGALARRTPEERAKTFERILKMCAPGAELVKCEIVPKDLRDTSAPMSVKLAAKFPEMVIRGESRDELTVPTLSKTLGFANFLLEGNTSLEKRRFTLKVDTTASVREHLAIDLGQALGEVLELPPGEKTANGYDYARTFAVTNGTLVMDRSLTVSAVEFDPEAYRKLREEIVRVEASERKKPVFASDRLHDANVRRILDSSETTLFSDTSWVTTNIDVTEVLTYKGKKDSAELKFNCHPSWKQIDLVSATVSNRNGKVYSVTPREVNEMDCGWAASAPRYPAGKLKVVNLPSVEIGSVISVKTVVTVTNAPAPFYACMYLDSFSPVDRLVRRVDDFKHDSGKVKRLPDEPSQPDGRLWRDHKIFTRGNWETAAEKLKKAAEELKKVDLDCGGEDAPAPEGIANMGRGRLAPAPEGTANMGRGRLAPADEIKLIRDWMAKYVKLAGPSLYELPLDRQLTDPEVVVKERYATRLDYIRTLCALLRGAGYDADVVFAANNAKEADEIRRLNKFEKPNIRAYSLALCRVRVREGGFLWFGGETKEYFIGTENEYTPIGTTAYEGSDYFDPASGEFGIVANSAAEFATRDDERCEIDVRENGAVDITVRNLSYGAQVGAFRKKFSEILPEMRSRFYQTLLGDIAQAASATSELVTDTEGYPSSLGFSCFVPDYATVGKDAISITLPPFDEMLPNLTGTVRETPIAVPATDLKVETVVVRFPEGYTEIEHLPESFSQWMDNRVSSEVRDGILAVTIRRHVGLPNSLLLDALRADCLKACRRRSSSRANRTIIVRKPAKRQ